jgi:hypothetical protein
MKYSCDTYFLKYMAEAAVQIQQKGYMLCGLAISTTTRTSMPMTGTSTMLTVQSVE